MDTVAQDHALAYARSLRDPHDASRHERPAHPARQPNGGRPSGIDRGALGRSATPRREPAMRIAVIGAGAIGGYVGVELALAGEEVTFIVRGANLDAIRSRGMRLIMKDGSERVAKGVTATNDYA